MEYINKSCKWRHLYEIYDYDPFDLHVVIAMGGMLCQKQGAVSIRKTVLPGMAIPMLKIRRPNGRLICNM